MTNTYKSVSVANWAGRQIVNSLLDRVSPKASCWNEERDKAISKLRKVIATANAFYSDASEYWSYNVIDWLRDINTHYKTDNDVKWAILNIRWTVGRGWNFETRKV